MNAQGKPNARERKAREIVLRMLRKAGAKVEASRAASAPADIHARLNGRKYVVEIKAGAEGRADRLLPLWSQALLQVSARAKRNGEIPLAVIVSDSIRERVAEQILKFAAEYVPDAAVGVIDLAGRRRFRGPGLEGLNADPAHNSPAPHAPPSADLFSDLNQWMLKVLFASDLPKELLNAPRNHFLGPNDLAEAANVSLMSAFRLIRQLDSDGFIARESGHIRLVRREELLRRWQQASGAKPVREIPAKFLLRRDVPRDVERLSAEAGGCLAMFSAAEKLELGFVHGVPPCLYVRDVGPGGIVSWKNVAPAKRNDIPDFFVRRAHAKESVFRGAVNRDGVLVCDVIQVWLDVAHHPSRGAEQADLIYKRVLQPKLLSYDG